MTVFSRSVGPVYNDRSYSLGTRPGMLRLPMDDKLELEDQGFPSGSLGTSTSNPSFRHGLPESSHKDVKLGVATKAFSNT